MAGETLTPEQKAEKRRKRQLRNQQQAQTAASSPPPAGDKEFYISRRSNELSQNYSRKINKNGVRTRGMSPQEAGRKAEEEWTAMDDGQRNEWNARANGNRSSDYMAAEAASRDAQPGSTWRQPNGRRAGIGTDGKYWQEETATRGTVNPNKSSGFRSTLRDPGEGASVNGKGGFAPTDMGEKLVLRSEAERQARISESPLTVRPRLLTSKRDSGEVINSRDGDFNAEESRMYADRARRMGFGSARPPGAMATAPAAPAAPAAPKLPSAPGSPTMIPTARPGPTAAPTVEALNAARQANQRSSERARRMTGSPTMIPTARPEPTAAPTVEALDAARKANQRSSERAGARIAAPKTSPAAPKTVTPDLTKTSSPAAPEPPPTGSPSPTPLPAGIPPLPKSPTRPRVTKPWTGETKEGSYFSGMKPNASGRTYRPAGWTQDMENKSAIQGKIGNVAAAVGKAIVPARALAMTMYNNQARTVTDPKTWKQPAPEMIRPPSGISGARA